MTNEEVARLAYDVVLKTMAAGEATHPPQAWEKESVDWHVERAFLHAADAEAIVEDGSAWIEELEHAATRCILALAVYAAPEKR